MSLPHPRCGTTLPILYVALSTHTKVAGLVWVSLAAKRAQPFAHRAIGNPHLSLHTEPRAFLLGSLKAMVPATALCPIARPFLAALPPSNVSRLPSILLRRMVITVKAASRNVGNDLCFITCWFSAIEHVVHLIGWHFHIPVHVVVFRTVEGAILHVHAAALERVMHFFAQSVYRLHPIKNKAELQTWSSHSICVGACVLLHSQGCPDTQIVPGLLRLSSQSCFLLPRPE
jgi:hypothetical protein